jgi:hypothetical protein
VLMYGQILTGRQAAFLYKSRTLWHAMDSLAVACRSADNPVVQG